MKVQLGLSNYATKTDLKNATATDKSSFAENTDSANYSSDVDKFKLRNEEMYQLI